MKYKSGSFYIQKYEAQGTVFKHYIQELSKVEPLYILVSRCLNFTCFLMHRVIPFCPDALFKLSELYIKNYKKEPFRQNHIYLWLLCIRGWIQYREIACRFHIWILTFVQNPSKSQMTFYWFWFQNQKKYLRKFFEVKSISSFNPTD